MNRIASSILVLVFALHCTSCIGGARGSVAANAVQPTWEALATYTRAGILGAEELTQEQRENLTRELDVSLGQLRRAVKEVAPAK